MSKKEVIIRPTDTTALDKRTADITQRLVDEEDVDKVKDLTHIFNMQMAKKNAMRINKLSDVLDKVSDEMASRLTARPSEFSNQDLINYMNAAQNTIDRSAKVVASVDETPVIANSYQQNNVTVNIEDSISRESRDNILSALNKFFENNSIEADYEDKTGENQK